MGHGGADFFTMNNFVRAVANDEPALIGTGVLVRRCKQDVTVMTLVTHKTLL